MIGTFYQTLSLGDLVYMRDWDESVNDWIVVSERAFIVIDVKHDPSSTERNRDIVSVLGPENRVIEVYAGYFVKAV